MDSSDLPTRIVLIDRTPAMAVAWKRAFGSVEGVEVVEGDYFSCPADAMVSPANSFGIMDGGLDAAIRHTLGFEVQRAAQRAILDKHHGELAVGQAEVVRTPHSDWPWLIVAPTMRTPESVARTPNAYLAFRAVLLVTARFNRAGEDRIDSLVCPGLGTGIGAMDYERCATQMFLAHRQVSSPARIPSFRQILQLHEALVRS
ncbi:MAG: macro domain-containing protein [Myxococcota bacterium]